MVCAQNYKFCSIFFFIFRNRDTSLLHVSFLPLRNSLQVIEHSIFQPILVVWQVGFEVWFVSANANETNKRGKGEKVSLIFSALHL